MNLYEQFGETYTIRPKACAPLVNGKCAPFEKCCKEQCAAYGATTFEYWCLKYKHFAKYSMGCVCVVSGPGSEYLLELLFRTAFIY